MNSCRKGRRSQSNRKKISDTTGLSLFIRQPPPEQASSRARNRCATGAMAPRGRSSGVRAMPEQRSAPSSAPKIQESGPAGMNSSVTALVRQDADVDAILSRGGLRLMQNMSVYLTRDEQIIFADLSSGMAALVTGVSKVGDTELAIISGAYVGRCTVLNSRVNDSILAPPAAQPPVDVVLCVLTRGGLMQRRKRRSREPPLRRVNNRLRQPVLRTRRRFQRQYCRLTPNLILPCQSRLKPKLIRVSAHWKARWQVSSP